MITQALQAKHNHARALLRKPGVVAVGVGYKRRVGRKTGDVAVVVSVVEKLPPHALATKDIVPYAVDDVPTDVIQTGPIRANNDRTGKWLPAPGGVSVGHKDITAGTLGCLVQSGGETFILSNNHVLANSNAGQIGDAVLQPGPHDGGTMDDQIATLHDYVPVHFDIELPGCSPVQRLVRLLGLRIFQNGPNLVDAAIAKPLAGDLVERRILDVGEPAGMAEAELGLIVQKSGRTTGLTQGIVNQVAMTVQVLYGTAIATFEDQVAGDLGNDGGDSGSVVLDMDGRVVGLLFAGGEGVTIFNRFANVADLLGVSV